MAGSDKRYTFKLATNDENTTIRVFESAIDLLSYATMLKDIGKDYHTENLISLEEQGEDERDEHNRRRDERNNR
jgi:hypothetical protein